jgi:23S rRNA (uridine2552-2'-O)-methyltransferase
MATYRPHDRYFRKAREQGLPSRAAFKIEELLGRFHLTPPGAYVIDLGCSPGGWLAILSRTAGAHGRVLGFDLVSCNVRLPNVSIMTADIRDPAAREAAVSSLGGLADLVTSDLAPKLTGIVDHDQARMAELIGAALGLAQVVLRPGGAMVAKVFMGAEFENIVASFRKLFKRVEVVHVRASRPGSAELYIVARGRLGGPRVTGSCPDVASP